MSATLPTSLLVGHIMSDAEWNQLITGIKSLSNIELFWSISTVASTTSTTYVDVTGASVSFTKYFDSSTSDVGVISMSSATSGTSNAIVSFGVNDGASDHDLSAQQQLTIAKHYNQHGFTTLTGLAAGAYTFHLRYKHSTGASNASINAADTITLLIFELAR